MFPDRPKVTVPKDSLFYKFFGQPLHAEDIVLGVQPPEVAVLRDDTLQAGNMVTAVVGSLRNPKLVPLPRINKLMKLFWNLVGWRHVPVLGGTGVKSVHFYCEDRGGRAVGCIMMPPQWSKMMMEDPVMQTGAIIFAASQAQDFWTKKYLEAADYQKRKKQNPLLLRAYAYESDWLHYIKRVEEAPKLVGLESQWKPNDYQRDVLNNFPNGYDSLDPELQYETPEWEGPES